MARFQKVVIEEERFDLADVQLRRSRLFRSRLAAVYAAAWGRLVYSVAASVACLLVLVLASWLSGMMVVGSRLLLVLESSSRVLGAGDCGSRGRCPRLAAVALAH